MDTKQNQCDGCQAGIPVENGIHRMGKGVYPDYMVCTKEDYNGETPMTKHTQTIEERVKEVKQKWVDTPCRGIVAHELEWLDAVLTSLIKEAEYNGEATYRQFILNILDGIDKADGSCNTKAIRFAIQSRFIPNNKDNE